MRYVTVLLSLLGVSTASHAQTWTKIAANPVFSVSIGPDLGHAARADAPTRHNVAVRLDFREPQVMGKGEHYASVQTKLNFYCLNDSWGISDVRFLDQEGQVLSGASIFLPELTRISALLQPVVADGICWTKVANLPEFSLEVSREREGQTSDAGRTVWSRLDFKNEQPGDYGQRYASAWVNWKLDCQSDRWQATDIKVRDRDGGNLLSVKGTEALEQAPVSLKAPIAEAYPEIRKAVCR